MTDPRKAALMRSKKRLLKTYAELVLAGNLKDREVYLVDHVDEQMLLPTMDVYLSTQISMPVMPNKCISRRSTPRQKAPATVRVWERLF